MKKIDLHCHLDGSLSLTNMKHLEMHMKASFRYTDEELLKLIRAPKECDSLKEYLKRFELPLEYLCTLESFRDAVYQLMKEAADEGVAYLEIRFAPLLSKRPGMTCEQIVETAVTGLREAERDFPIRGNLIVIFMRNHEEEVNIELLKRIYPYIGKGVCAIDTAGDEAGFPMHTQERLFRLAAAEGIPFTIHAGECGSIKNIEEAIDLGASRIGHGIALKDAPALRKRCMEERIGIELCPTSNLQTKAVESLIVYPIKLFIQEHLLVTVNTDNRTVSNTTMSNELALVEDAFLVDPELLFKNAVETAFADDQTKEWLLK